MGATHLNLSDGSVVAGIVAATVPPSGAEVGTDALNEDGGIVGVDMIESEVSDEIACKGDRE